MPNRKGAALLEAMVAMTLLATAGLAFVELGASALRVTHLAQISERRTSDMSRLLAAYTLLDRRDLGRLLGTRLAGSYSITVERDGLDLFHIVLSDPASGDSLATTVYRPEAESDN